jgi:hypothetical protein
VFDTPTDMVGAAQLEALYSIEGLERVDDGNAARG